MRGKYLDHYFCNTCRDFPLKDDERFSARPDVKCTYAVESLAHSRG